MKLLRQILGPLLALLLTFGSVVEVSAPITVAAAGMVLGVGHAQAATPAQKAVVLGGVPSWVLRANGALPSIDMDFAHNRAWVGGSGPRAPPSLLTTTRASTEMAPWSDQHWTSFASGAPAITDFGLSVWQAATNTALQSRDMTQTAWVKTTMTAALTAAGIDNAANSATTLTATAGNATVLQTLTIGSTAEIFSIFVERVTGTGNIQITEDNGSTWTTMSASNCVNTQGVGTAINTTTFVRCSVEAVLANPVIGVRIVTNGDVINVDAAQNEANTFATPPIFTTTVSATRAKDLVSVKNAANYLGAGPWSLYSEQTVNSAAVANSTLFSVDDGTTNNGFYIYAPNGTTGLTRWSTGAGSSGTGGTGFSYVIGTKFRAGEIYRAGAASYMGVLGHDSLPVTAPSAALTTILIGSSEWGGDGTGNGFHSRLTIWRSDITNAHMLGLIQ